MNDSFKLKTYVRNIHIKPYLLKKKENHQKRKWGFPKRRTQETIDVRQIKKGFIRLYIIHICMNIKDHTRWSS